MKIKMIQISWFVIALISNSKNMPMMEMAVMMGAQQGASVANEAINEMFADMSSSIQKEQGNIQDSMKSFTNNVIGAQSQEAQFLGKIFEQAIQHVGTEESSQSQYTQQMQQYIFKMLSLHQPAFYYLLEGATTFDQVFTHATMFTPTGPTWKNIFAKGNWEYDQDTDSFWQLLKEPITTNANTDSSSALSASYNCIFTEYFTNAASYEIQCEITLYNIDYPCFAGVMFNKTRWISGNADSLTKCRLIGIAAHSKDNVGVYFAEQYNKHAKTTMSSKNTANIKLLYPLNQIVNQETKPAKTLSKNSFANLRTDPPTFIIRIITSPETIQLKIWQKGTKEPSEFITMKSHDKDLFIYHNIGFMAPGALAEFKLIKPESLTFSTDAKKQYTQDLQDIVSHKKTVAKTKK